MTKFPPALLLFNCRWFPLCVCLLATCMSAGCGPPKDEVFRVHGKVTFKGKPVPKGNVFFDPDGTKGTSGRQGFAGITDGVYDTSLPDGDGIKKGNYTIRVQAFDGKPLPDLPFGNGLTTEFVTTQSFAKDDNEFDIVIGK
ncbi:MAG TPA: hypothetical protein VM260_06920 [Pirellula sp.]|nr:hypothetical protein [Pirellula sp.]